MSSRKVARRYYALLGFACFHFVMVALGAWHIEPFERLRPLSKALSLYQAYTGADSGYEFFAPDVGSQLRAIFEIVDAQGTRQLATLETRTATEADLRIGNIINLFWSEGTDANLRRSIAASWAGRMFGRYPRAKQVLVRVQEYELPSMEAFRKGVEPAWHDYYVATFQPKRLRSGS